MTGRRGSSSPAFMILLTALLLAMALLVAGDRSGSAEALGNCTPVSGSGCEGYTPETATPQELPFLSQSEACVDVGYLCSALKEQEMVQFVRWPTDTDRLVIRISVPDTEDTHTAREFRKAVVRGFEAWQGYPFQLMFRERPGDEPVDLEVRWAQQLSGRRIGLTEVEWTQRGNDFTYEVKSVTLALRSPVSGLLVSPWQLQLTAAHELGHVLGLPHSDSQRDVMYPQNTARRLSARDYKTLQALYRLQNGVQIRGGI